MLSPVVTVVGLQFGALLSGAVLTETVFGRVGVGRYVVTAITARDYPVVQGTVIVVALFVVTIRFVSQQARVPLRVPDSHCRMVAPCSNP